MLKCPSSHDINSELSHEFAFQIVLIHLRKATFSDKPISDNDLPVLLLLALKHGCAYELK